MYVKERLELTKEVRNLGVESLNMDSILKVQAEQDKIYSSIMKYDKAIGIDWRI